MVWADGDAEGCVCVCRAANPSWEQRCWEKGRGESRVHQEDSRSHRKERERHVGLKEGQTLDTNPESGHPVTPQMEPQAALSARRKPGCGPVAVARLVLRGSRQQGDPSVPPRIYPFKQWL